MKEKASLENSEETLKKEALKQALRDALKKGDMEFFEQLRDSEAAKKWQLEALTQGDEIELKELGGAYGAPGKSKQEVLENQNRKDRRNRDWSSETELNPDFTKEMPIPKERYESEASLTNVKKFSIQKEFYEFLKKLYPELHIGIAEGALDERGKLLGEEMLQIDITPQGHRFINELKNNKLIKALLNADRTTGLESRDYLRWQEGAGNIPKDTAKRVLALALELEVQHNQISMRGYPEDIEYIQRAIYNAKEMLKTLNVKPLSQKGLEQLFRQGIDEVLKKSEKPPTE